MSSSSTSRHAVAAAIACALWPAGCSVGGDSAPTPLPQDAGPGEEAYPEGPYGIGVGSVIDPYAFTGYVDPSTSMGAGSRVPIDLADFYNPTGRDTYPEGSPFGSGDPKPRGLMINVSAVWCGPCQNEARNVLPGKYDELGPRGAEFLLNLADSREPGVAATFEDLDAWVTSFTVRYPSVIDPTYQLGALFDSSSFPANILVDTRDMTIVQTIAGVPEESFWSKFEELLDAP